MPGEAVIETGTSPAVRLVVSDIDGTLVTPDKVLTPRALAAARAVVDAGIAFTITSGRPPVGMSALIAQLQLTDPIAAFNGGLLVRPDLTVVREHPIAADTAQAVFEILIRERVDVWAHTDTTWYVRDPDGAHVAHEQQALSLVPTAVSTFSGLGDRVFKIVGVSDDDAALARCAAGVQRQCGNRVSASRSQSYYLDVTHPMANKGDAVLALSELLAVPTAEIVTIGDMPTDVFMFRRSGTSIAMGNAAPDVRRAATQVTASNANEGFALAMERFVLRMPAG